jgi:ATP-binding cassette subfamily B protein
MQKSFIGNLFEKIAHYRNQLLLASLMVFISNGLLIVNPLIFRQALLDLQSAHHHSVFTWAFGLLIISAVAAFLKYSMRMIFFSISRHMELQMRELIFDRIHAQSKAFFDRHGIGDLLSRLSNDITAYSDMLAAGIMYPLFFISLVVPALAALFYLSPFMAAISLIPFFGMFLLNLWVSKPMFHISHRLQELLAKMSVMVHEHYSGIKLIKSYGIESQLVALFKHLCSCFSRLNLRFAGFQGLFLPALAFIIKLTMLALVAIASAVILLHWGPPISLADFLTFIWIQSYVFNPLLMLAWIIPTYQRGKAAYARLFEVYQEPIEVYQVPHALKHIAPQANIEFRNLTFTYPGQTRPALQHINLTIKGGTFVGLTGPVGCGKTTLFRLLNREYEVAENTLFIGGKDIHQYSLDAFYQQIVTVEQLPFLFSKSIWENIKFGRPTAEEDDVHEASQLANLHLDVLEFPLGYQTIVGERGVSLSGGQKQRMAIARAFLVNRSILLLDDIFSAVDTNTERKIFASLQANFKGKTILLITHRASLLEKLDRVIYLMDGVIKEDGKPSELVKKAGPYKALVDLQKM